MSQDRAQFEAMFRTHHPAVYRYVARRVEAVAVQDLVSETFLVAWRRRGDIRGEPLPWLLGVARRVCANHLRAGARREALDQRLAVQPRPETEPAQLLADPEFRLALAGLADADREALLLVAWDGLTNREAAKVAGCSAGTFTVRLHRARRRLAKALQAHAHLQVAETNRQEGVAVHELI